MFARLLATVSVLLLFGSAAFAQVIALQSRGGSHIGNNSPRAIVVADLNNDGKPDFATAGYGINGVTVDHGTGESGFHISAEAIPTGAGPFAMTSADVNSDGRLDLIVANADADTVTVLVNDPSDPAGFRRAFDWAVPGSPRGVAAGDFDRDGDIDLAATSTLNNQVYVAKGF